MKEIQVPLYNHKVTLIGGDPDEVKIYLWDKFDVDSRFDNSVTQGVCIHEYGHSWIWFRKKDVSVSLLVHELCHATFDIMEDVGLDIKDQEAFCYIIDYLTRECENLFAIQMGRICPR